tara:strand:- start:68 stop:442 length:375 start_codon:yes stop_codon:yes gene_type:complete
VEGFFVNTLVLDDEVLDPFTNTLVLGDGVDVVGVGFVGLILVGVGVVVFVVVGGFVLVGVGFVLVGVDPLEPLILTYPLTDKPDFPFCATVDALFPVPIFLIALLTPDDMEDDVAVEGVEPNLA